jgi:hypothetical protein
MRPTKMLPVRGSLCESQKLGNPPEDFQSHPQPNQGFSRRSKATVTKNVTGLLCLVVFSVGVVFLEYKMLLLLGAVLFAFGVAFAVAVISTALYRAPEGDERPGGLHIRQRNRPKRFSFSTFGRLIRTHESLKSARM